MQFIVILYQLQITLYALLLGLFLGVLYDVLRITRMLTGITPVHVAHISWIGRLPMRRIEHRRVLLYIPVCAEQRSFSVVFASRMRAGIFCVLLQCRKAGAISFRIYSGFSPRNNRMHPIFIDPTTDMDWEMGLQASGSSKTADSAQTADSSNGKMEKKLGKESPVYIKENGKFKERYGFIHG